MQVSMQNCFRLTAILLFMLPLGTHADILDEILTRGKLRVGISLFTPWAMKTASGELVGFEVEVAKKLTKDMGVEPEFKVYVWENIIAALKSGEIDVIIAGMAITPARALQLNFSVPYAESGVSLATNTKMTAGVKGLRELNQPAMTVATVSQTLAFDLTKLLFDKANLQVFATSDEAEKAVLEGKAHAYVASSIETTFLALENPGKVDLPLSKPLLASVAGMGVKKGEQELLNFLNAWVTARTADKWLSATHKHWFTSLEWREQVRK